MKYQCYLQVKGNIPYVKLKNKIIINVIRKREMESVLIHLLYVDENQNSIYALREDLLPFSFGGNKYRIAKKYIEDMKQKKCTIMVGWRSPI